MLDFFLVDSLHKSWTPIVGSGLALYRQTSIWNKKESKNKIVEMKDNTSIRNHLHIYKYHFL